MLNKTRILVSILHRKWQEICLTAILMHINSGCNNGNEKQTGRQHLWQSWHSGNNSASLIKAEQRERKQRSQEEDDAEEDKELLFLQSQAQFQSSLPFLSSLPLKQAPAVLHWLSRIHHYYFTMIFSPSLSLKMKSRPFGSTDFMW